MALWGQESSRNVTSPELRKDNVAFIKTIGIRFHPLNSLRYAEIGV